MAPHAADDPLSIVDAVKAGDLAAVQRLARVPASVNAAEADGTTALHWAVRADHAAMVRVLLRAGANAKVANSTASRRCRWRPSTAAPPW